MEAHLCSSLPVLQNLQHVDGPPLQLRRCLRWFLQYEDLFEFSLLWTEATGIVVCFDPVPLLVHAIRDMQAMGYYDIGLWLGWFLFLRRNWTILVTYQRETLGRASRGWVSQVLYTKFG